MFNTNPEITARRLMKHLIPAVLVAFTSLIAPASAQSPVVVELFTSQGCAACPPADKLIYELTKRDDVIPLALHVDYWDYIGWKDEFGNPAYSDRQRGYASEGGRRSVYTPQMIINGTTDIVGARAMDLTKAIAEQSAKPSPVSLKVSRTDDVLAIAATSSQMRENMVVHLVRYQPERTSAIKRGENAGKTLVFANVVEDWKILQEWDGIMPLDLEMPVTGPEPLVVMIQQGRFGAILAAEQIR